MRAIRQRQRKAVMAAAEAAEKFEQEVRKAAKKKAAKKKATKKKAAKKKATKKKAAKKK